MADADPGDRHLQVLVGEGLRRWRRRKGLSQVKAATELGVHWSYIGDIERGNRNLTLKTVEQWAHKMDVEPLDLLRGLPGWATE